MNKHCYSYHIFYFPFKWHLPEEEKKLLSEQVDLKHNTCRDLFYVGTQTNNPPR